MTDKNKAISALLAVFPTPEAFDAFAENSENSSALRSFIAYAGREKIAESTESGFRSFIRRHSRSLDDCMPPSNLDFEEVLEKKGELLKLKMSARVLTDSINKLLKECRIDLPQVSNTMLTRLKKESADTAHKKNVLRSLAFWLGHERTDLGLKWNYEVLLKLCRGERSSSYNYHEGVRIGFALYSRGDIIDHEIMEWLKKSLKQFIEKKTRNLTYGHWEKVRSRDITTLYVDFPKEEDFNDIPSAYISCLRSAVSLAHQIAIRWALSKHSTRNRFLAIGIAAGEYADLDNYLLPILNAKLPGDPVIRVTNYVRECLLINDIRVILCERPHETTLFSGEALNIWWIVGFWSMLYFDFVPELLEDPILKNDPESRKALIRLLYFSPEETKIEAGNSESNAVITFLKFPRNILLGMEIAKTLFYRRQLQEALEILRIVLSIEPADLTARTLRIVLLRTKAQNANTYGLFEGMLQQAEQEAEYIEEHCSVRTEDFYCEYGIIYMDEATQALRYARRNKGVCHDRPNLEQSKQTIFKALDKAERLFRKAMTVSPTSIRSSFMLEAVKMLKTILQNDESIFTDSKKTLNGRPDVVRQPPLDVLWQLGFMGGDLPFDNHYEFLNHMLITRGDRHDDSIALDTFRPISYFCHAAVLWDFVPVHTVASVKRILGKLHGAVDIAQKMAKYDVSLYSFTRFSVELQHVEEFLQHMKKCIRMVEEYAGADLDDRYTEEIIHSKEERTSLLLSLNF